mgnify:FL=1
MAHNGLLNSRTFNGEQVLVCKQAPDDPEAWLVKLRSFTDGGRRWIRVPKAEYAELRRPFCAVRIDDVPLRPSANSGDWSGTIIV